MRVFTPSSTKNYHLKFAFVFLKNFNCIYVSYRKIEVGRKPLKHSVSLNYRATYFALQYFFILCFVMVILIFAFIGSYRLTDFTMGVMSNPFYLDTGFTVKQIALSSDATFRSTRA